MKLTRGTWILMGMLAVLAALYVLVVVPREKGTLDRSETQFAVPDTANIVRVRLVRSLEGHPPVELLLERKPGGWLANGQYTVVPRQMQVLLRTLRNIETERPVNEAYRKTILESLKKRQIRVEVDHRHKGRRVFFVGSTTQDGRGSEALVLGAENPYICVEPGYPGSLEPRFRPDLNAYRENVLFHIQPQNLARVEVHYLWPDSGFILSRPSPNSPWKLANGPEPDAQAVAQYVNQFGKVYARAWANPEYPRGLDSLSRIKPDVRLVLYDFNGRPQRIRFYERPDNINQWFAVIEGDSELRTAQHAVVGKFFVRRPYFLGSSSPLP